MGKGGVRGEEWSYPWQNVPDHLKGTPNRHSAAKSKVEFAWDFLVKKSENFEDINLLFFPGSESLRIQFFLQFL